MFSVVPAAQRSLILITRPTINQRWDFELVADHVRAIAPDIQTAVLDDVPAAQYTFPPEFDRPTMTVSPGAVWQFQPPRGPVFHGRSLPKSEEYARLEGEGIPVPRWARLTEDQVPDLADFGPYVVVKPDLGGRGADVRIVRTTRVRWRPPTTDYARWVSGANHDWIVQEFLYTGPRPVSYRVATLFGEPLWALRTEADSDRRQLRHRYDFGGGGLSIVASGKGCTFRVTNDPEVLSLARRAHRAFPTIPLLGVDVLRDVDTGQLAVIEVNAVGLTWHLTSPRGLGIQADFGFDLDAHFDTRRTAARVLVEQVRQHAA